MSALPPSLWRQPDFLKLWSGQTVSAFGSSVTREALPYVGLLLLGATPLQMGLLAAASSAPVLAVSLIAGAWTDRLRRRPLLIAADLGRALLLLTIPIAALLGRLEVAHLLVVAALVGILTVLFDVANQAYLPDLVGREHLIGANSKLGVSGSLAEVTAPALAGILVQGLTAPFAILFDALSFLWSALMVGLIRQREHRALPIGPRRPLGREILEGVGVVRGQALLRAFAGAAGTSGFFGNFFATLYALYGLRVLGLTPAQVGLTVAMGGAGGLLGAALAAPLARRFGLGPVLLGAALIGRVVSLLMPLAGGPPLLAMLLLMLPQLIGDGAEAVYTIHVASLRQVIVPDRLLGRVNATMRLLSEGMAPLGALAGGVLGQIVGIRAAVGVAVLGSLFGALWLIYSPIGTVRQLPTAAGEGEPLPRAACFAAGGGEH